MQERLEWAWAAGIIDGEGTIYIAKITNKRPKKTYTYQRPRIAVAQYGGEEAPEMLIRLMELFGGSVNGPYGPYRSAVNTKKRQFVWQIQGYQKVIVALCSMWSWMGEVKRQQAVKALKFWLED